MNTDISPMITEAGIDRLFAAARQVRGHAHAPYSHFAVGAAVLSDADGIAIGCNVENAAYPLGLCAEAAAIGAMVAAGGRQIRAIAIVGGRGGETAGPVMPCGGCRQRIAEFAEAGTLVLTLDATRGVRRSTFSELLPDAFTPAALRRDP